MFDINDDKFGFCTGFEFDGPVGEAGCDDKVCLFSFFISIGFIVCTNPFADFIQGEELSAVSVSGEDKVGFGIGLIVIVIGLVIENNGEFFFIQALQQFIHVLAGIAAQNFREVFAPDDIKAVVNQSIFILKNFNVVLFQFSHCLLLHI